MALIWAKLAELVILGVLFPLTLKPYGDDGPTLFLAGAGKIGEIFDGEYITHAIDGVYLEESAVESLSAKWGEMTSDELATSDKFYRDIYNGHFEKITQVTFVNRTNGEKYSNTVATLCVTLWEECGVYDLAKAEAIKKFTNAFAMKTFHPYSSIFYTHSPLGSLKIAFSKDGTLPESNSVVIKNRALSNTILELLIGKNGLSGSIKKSIAQRLAQVMK